MVEMIETANILRFATPREPGHPRRGRPRHRDLRRPVARLGDRRAPARAGAAADPLRHPLPRAHRARRAPAAGGQPHHGGEGVGGPHRLPAPRRAGERRQVLRHPRREARRAAGGGRGAGRSRCSPTSRPRSSIPRGARAWRTGRCRRIARSLSCRCSVRALRSSGGFGRCECSIHRERTGDRARRRNPARARRRAPDAARRAESAGEPQGASEMNGGGGPLSRHRGQGTRAATRARVLRARAAGGVVLVDPQHRRRRPAAGAGRRPARRRCPRRSSASTPRADGSTACEASSLLRRRRRLSRTASRPSRGAPAGCSEPLCASSVSISTSLRWPISTTGVTGNALDERIFGTHTAPGRRAGEGCPAGSARSGRRRMPQALSRSRASDCRHPSARAPTSASTPARARAGSLPLC